MPHFLLFFKTAALRDRLLPAILARLPGWFEFSVLIGTPAAVTLTDPDVAGFPLPLHAGDAYIFDDEIPARAAGVATSMRAAVRVMPGDSDAVLVMRLWHELLHAVGQPADDMRQMANEWQTPIERLLWVLWPYFVGSHDSPFWHGRFYAWLTVRAEEAAA